MKILKILSLLLICSGISQAQTLFQISSQGEISGEALAQSEQGDMVVAGYYQGSVNFNPNGSDILNSELGGKDVFFAKYDKNGEFKWAKSFGSGGIDIPTDVEIDRGGNIYVAGYFGALDVPGRFIDLDPSDDEAKFIGEGGIDAFLAKYDSLGNYLWGFILGNIDGNTTDIIWDISINYTDEIFIAGSFAGVVDFNPRFDRDRIACPTDGNGVFVVKYDEGGKNIWTSVVGCDVNEPLFEGSASVAADGSGGCFIGGSFRDTAKFNPEGDFAFPVVSAGETDVFLAKYSSYGKLKYRGGFGGEGKETLGPGAFKMSADGAIYVAGTFEGKCDFYAGIGEYEIENESDSASIFLASYSQTGTLQWANALQSDGFSDSPTRLDFDYEDAVVLSGWFRGAMDFDPYGSCVLNSNGKDGAGDAFLAKYDYTGGFVWARRFGQVLYGEDRYGTLQISKIGGLVVDSDGNSLVTGKFYGDNVDFDPSDADTSLTATNLCDMFVAAYDYDGYLWQSGVVRPRLRVISPNGGEIWQVDSLRTITWDYKHVDTVDIEYSINSGENWSAVANSIPAASSSYTWKIPEVVSENCRVKITDSKDSSVYDISNRDFQITDQIQPEKVIFAIESPAGADVRAVAANPDGKFAAAGSFKGTINLDRGKGQVNFSSDGAEDSYVAKYDETGDLIWAFKLGEEGGACRVSAFAADKYGNLYLAGSFRNPSNDYVDFDPSSESNKKLTSRGGYDCFLAKYDEDGNFLWAFSLGDSEGATKEEILDLSVEPNGTVFIAGNFTGSVDFNPELGQDTINATRDELFIAKYSANGNFHWAIGINPNLYNFSAEKGIAIAPDYSGGCFVAANFADTVNVDPKGYLGYELFSKGETDVFLARYEINGYLDWATQIQGKKGQQINPGCMKYGKSDNLLITGVFKGRTTFNPGLYEKTIENTDTLNDIFIAQYKKSGDFVWAKSADVNGEPMVAAIDDSSFILLGGYFEGTANFGLSESSATLSSNGKDGAKDAFITKYSNTGNLLWTNHFGADTSGERLETIVHSISLDSNNYIYAAGTFNEKEVDFNPSISEKTILSSEGVSDGFIAKYRNNGGLWIQAPDTARLYLLAPNGGEQWQIGSVKKIKWKSEYIDTVAIQSSTDGGNNWNNVVEYYNANAGFYEWLVPDAPSDSCKVKIFDPNKTSRVDISEETFSIVDKVLKLTYPDGGETLVADNKDTIHWESENIERVDIKFSSDDGANWKDLGVLVPASEGSLSWIVHKTESDSCKIRISESSNSQIFDETDVFSIVIPNKPTLALQKPNGGEIWISETTENVEWVSSNLDNIDIELSTDGGFSWDAIATQVNANAGEFEWEIPIMPSDSCLIKALSSEEADVFDESDSLFAIKLDDPVYDFNDSGILCAEAFPNPFSSKTIIKYKLKRPRAARLIIFDKLGKVIYKSRKSTAAKEGKFVFDAADVPQGIYYYRIKAENSSIFGRILNVR